PTPDDHLAAAPHCRVICSSIGRTGRVGGYPTVGAGIVSSASVQIAAVISTPDDHLAAGPHCRVLSSGFGHVGPDAGGYPTVSAGVVSPAGVQIAGVYPDSGAAAD